MWKDFQTQTGPLNKAPLRLPLAGPSVETEDEIRFFLVKWPNHKRLSQQLL